MRRIRTNRSTLMYYLLTVITLGIYGIWFIYQMKNDVNDMCCEDGKRTPGILMLFLLSLVTCGVYSLIWYYGLCERIGRYLEVNGKPKDVDGAKYLLWCIVGSLVCGIGSIYATYILIKGMNNAAAVYNEKAEASFAVLPEGNSGNDGTASTEG